MIYALCFGSLITILYFYIVTILFTRNVVVDIDCYNFLNSQLFSPKLWLRSSLTYYGSYCICFEISTFSSKSFSLIKFDLSFEIYAFGLATSHIGVLKKQTIFLKDFCPWLKNGSNLIWVWIDRQKNKSGYKWEEPRKPPMFSVVAFDSIKI